MIRYRGFKKPALDAQPLRNQRCELISSMANIGAILIRAPRRPSLPSVKMNVVENRRRVRHLRDFHHRYAQLVIRQWTIDAQLPRAHADHMRPRRRSDQDQQQATAPPHAFVSSAARKTREARQSPAPRKTSPALRQSVLPPGPQTTPTADPLRRRSSSNTGSARNPGRSGKSPGTTKSIKDAHIP